MSSVASFSCWALLLLTMIPFLAVSGRHIPDEKVTNSTPTPQVQLAAFLAAEEMGFSGDTFGDCRQFQDVSHPAYRKHLRGVKVVNKGDPMYGHRLLVGSAPPSCQGKCGSCNPCSPIHISIGSPHGALTQQEYYPEVWRCKCGNMLFMP